MKINEINLGRADAASKIQKESTSNSHPAATTNSVSAQPLTQDRVSTGHTVTSLTEKALQPLPSRQAKVDALKQSVKGGEYQLDSAKIAASLASANI